MLDEIKIKLSNNIEYAANGQGDLLTNEMTIKCPSYNDRNYKRELKQHFSRAMMQGQKMVDSISDEMMQKILAVQEKEAKPENENQQKDGKGILEMFRAAAEPGEYPKIIENFERFLIKGKGVCTIGAEGERADLTASLLQKINPDDIETAFGDYLENFISPSMQ